MFNIDPLVELGKRLESESIPSDVLDSALRDNEWFDRDNIESSLRALQDKMLKKECLLEFVQSYSYKECHNKSVALIMAGNIPFVGFADLLYCVICGVKSYIKYSSKDYHTMRWLVGLLKECSPELFIEQYDSQKVDMVIATGSNNSNRYFEYHFSEIPSIMRGSRESMAVISANVSERELKALWNDVFLRYGQGCRNVSMLYIEKGFDIESLVDLWRDCRVESDHFLNCYRQQKALMVMRKEMFYDLGYSTLVERKSLIAPVSQLNFAFYDNKDELEQFIADNRDNLQCVLTECDFGKAQFPTLSDYADNIDVMNFLLQ